MQDPRGLIAAFGGAAEFAARLDGLFTLPEQVAGMGVTLDVSGLIGQYAHGNEPSQPSPELTQSLGPPPPSDTHLGFSLSAPSWFPRYVFELSKNLTELPFGNLYSKLT